MRKLPLRDLRLQYPRVLVTVLEATLASEPKPLMPSMLTRAEKHLRYNEVEGSAVVTAKFLSTEEVRDIWKLDFDQLQLELAKQGVLVLHDATDDECRFALTNLFTSQMK